MQVTVLSTGRDSLLYPSKSREWCELKCEGYPNGCEKYGTRSQCPPTAPLLDQYFDLDRALGFVVVRFDLDAQSERLKAKPRLDRKKWTDKQARCLLYWQGTVDKKVREETKKVMKKEGYEVWTDKPEAMGLNVISTLRKLGIPIKAKIEKEQFIYKVAMVGFRNEGLVTPATIEKCRALAKMNNQTIGYFQTTFEDYEEC